MSGAASEGTTLELRWSGVTDAGRFRKNNEDAFLALNFDAQEIRYLGKIGQAPLDGGDFIFAVSDGMGGANAGEFASRIAVQKLTHLLPPSFKLSAMGFANDCTDLLGELFVRIHNEMTDMSHYYEECQGMGATLSLCWFTPKWMYFAHIGDSRIYYFPKRGDETIKQITHDHSYVGELVRKGRINEREARVHPERNILSQVLGGRCLRIEPQVGAVGYESGDQFVLCTDGVNDSVWDRRIGELVKQPPERFASMPPAERLIKDALEESARDNLTAVVVEVL